jgi:Zn-dependent protease with chaperone function
MWITSFLTLLGLEARALVFGGQPSILLGLLLTFCASVLLIRRLFVPCFHRRLVPADPQVEEAVQRRAEELGVARDLFIGVIPNSWSKADGRAYCVGRKNYLALTRKAQALLLVDDRLAFFALVDHELGHVANRDARLLGLARALRVANLTGLVLKVATIALIGSIFTADRISEFYRGLIPQSSTVEPSGGLTTSWVMHKRDPTLSTSSALNFAVAYSLSLLFLFEVFYVVAVRRREFWADEFAIVNARNPDAARGALMRLLREPPGGTLGTHSFLGSGHWHPSPEQRMDSICEGAATVHGSYIGVTSFLTLCLLVSFRFVLGNSGVLNDFAASGTLQLISLFYIFMCGYCIACLVHPTSGRGGKAAYSSYLAAKQLVIASSAVAAVLWTLYNLSGGFDARDSFYDDGERRAVEGFHSLVELESGEIGWMFFSIPLVMAAFAVGYLSVLALCRLAGREERVSIASSTLGSLVAVAALWILSLAGGADVESGRHSNPALLSMESRMRRIQNSDDPVGEMQSGLAEAFRDLEAGEIWRRNESSRYAFRPPLSSLFLWQGPFRAGH